MEVMTPPAVPVLVSEKSSALTPVTFSLKLTTYCSLVASFVGLPARVMELTAGSVCVMV